jgi:hypothetical protein
METRSSLGWFPATSRNPFSKALPGLLADFPEESDRFLSFSPTDDFPAPRIVFKSLDSMLSELPVDNFVMVTDPIAEFELDELDPDELIGRSLFRTGEIVTLLSLLAENSFMAPSAPLPK